MPKKRQRSEKGTRNDDTQSSTDVQWINRRKVDIDGVTFGCVEMTGQTQADFLLDKSRSLLRKHVHLLDDVSRRARMVSIGIGRGGSIGLAAMHPRPAEIVAFERAPERVKALDELIFERHLERNVRCHYGVDLADKDTVRGLLDEEFAGETIDLVIDETSTDGRDATSTFEAIFPLMAPGGNYVVQQWGRRYRLSDKLNRLGEAGSSEALSWAAQRDRLVDALADPDDPMGQQIIDQCERVLVRNTSAAQAIRPAIQEFIEMLESRPPSPGVSSALQRLADLFDPSTYTAEPATDRVELYVLGLLTTRTDSPPPAQPDPTTTASSGEPLLTFATTLALVHGARPDVIKELTMDSWLTVQRGGTLLDPETFNLEDVLRSEPRIDAVFDTTRTS